jgi:hypothetical protein
MAVIAVKAGYTNVTAGVTARPGVVPPALKEAPGGLYPLKSSAWEIDEYRILSGWPVPVPDYDIHCEVMVSADDGSTLDNRDAAAGIVTGADLRWLADDSYWDQTSLTWTALQGEAPPWTAAANRTPTLVTDYDYAIDDERFTSMTVLNFDSDTKDYLACDLGGIMGGSLGYTVIMVLNPNSIYGDDPTVVEKALWGPPYTGDPAHPYPNTNWVMFSIRERAICMTTERSPRQVGPSIGDFLATDRPCYVALVVRRPTTAIYVATGPSNIRLKSLAVNGRASDTMDTRFWLGDAAATDSGTMDMALFDLGIYANPLTQTEVKTEFGLLSQAYGGDHR